MYKNGNLYPFVINPDFTIATPFAIKNPIEGVRGTATLNDNGTGYRVGDIVAVSTRWNEISQTQHEGQTIDTIASSVNKSAFTLSFDRNNKDAKMCILAIPHKWEWHEPRQLSTNEVIKNLTAKELENANNQANSFVYLLVSRNDNYTDRYLYVNGQMDNGKYNVLTDAITNSYHADTGKYFDAGITSDRDAAVTLATQRQTLTGYTMTQSIWDSQVTGKMAAWNDYILSRLEYNSMQEVLSKTLNNYLPFDFATINLLNTWMEDKEPLTNVNVISLHRAIPYGVSGANTISAACTPFETRSGGVTCTDYIIASSIDTNLPIFTTTLKSLNNMYNYLAGKEYVPDNAEELLVSDINLQTDWTVYVKGRQKPDIWLTENSRGLETYLSSEKNTLGITASDVKIQYRVPFWSSVDLSLWVKAGTNVPLLPNKNYDAMLTTSFDTLTTIGYQHLGWNEFAGTEELFTEWIQTGKVAPQELPYAQLQFRLYLNEKIYSSWCEFGIGFIGSPSVSDFSLMKNWGICLNPTDGSTVTIIYDEYPEGGEPDDYEPPIIDDSDPDITTPDPDKGNGTLPDSNTNEGINLLTVSYRLTENNMHKLGDFLWKGGFFSNIKLLNNSPIENIVSLKIMPCSVSAETSEIVIGNVDTDINADRVTNIPVVDVGSIKYTGYYNNFLDYAPYTQAYIFLPFIGFYELDPAHCINNTLSVKYAFDVIMGQCKAMLFVNNIYITSYEGACGIDVPLVGSNRAQLEGAFLASVVNAGTSGDLASGLGGVATNLLTAQFHSQRAGSYSPTLGWAETRRCYIVFAVPNSQYPKSFGHDKGFPCHLTYTLGQLSGFTQTIADPDISGIACTEAEGLEIKRLLTEGVYL